MVHPRFHNVLFIGMTAVNLLLISFLAGILYSPFATWTAVLGTILGGTSSPSSSSGIIFVEATRQAGVVTNEEEGGMRINIAKDAQLRFLQCLDTHYPQKREDFAHFLNCQALTQNAAEIGVQRGIHALQFLTKWEGNNLFLVDKWENVPADTYVDIANVPSMDDIKQAAEVNLKKFKSRFTVLNFWSEDAAKQVDDNSLDFVYLDARHDFNGVSADLAAWWPKLRPGGIMAGHDYCDGELPEGDFFVESAVVNFFHDKMLPSQSIYTTKEPDRYVSFFLQKLTAPAAQEPSVVNYPYQEVYPKYSMYYRLYDGKRKALEGYPQGEIPGESEFEESCNLLCSSDCDLRLDRVLELEMGYAVPENPNALDAGNDSGQKCSKDERSTGEDGQRKCSSPSEAVTTERGKFATAANATVNSEVKQQVEKKIAGYKRECLRRCGVTCGQREILFNKIWKEVRESSSLLNGFLDEDDEEEINLPSTTISPISTTATHYSSIVCPNRKNAFRWGVAFRENKNHGDPPAPTSSEEDELVKANSKKRQNSSSSQEKGERTKSKSSSQEQGGVLPGVSARQISTAPSRIAWNGSMLESPKSCLKDYNADDALDYYEYGRSIGNTNGSGGTGGGSLFTGQDEFDSLSPFSEMLCYYGAKLLWGRWGAPCPFV